MRKFLVIAGVILTSGCTTSPNTREAALTQATPVGAAQNCIRRSDISHTRIRDEKTVDFVMRGQQVYRNVLPYSCSGLATYDSFSYSTATDQLCSVDTITVRTTDGSPGVTCGLGKFQKIELPFKS
jgi:hypothetical protein